VLVLDSSLVSTSRRATSIAIAAGALAVAVAVALLIVRGSHGASAQSAGARPCSSYPTPGALAPTGTKVPAGPAAKYSVFSGAQQAVDKLEAAQLASLSA
jgi:hypothetical protein